MDREPGGLQSMGTQSQTQLSDWERASNLFYEEKMWLIYQGSTYIYIYIHEMFNKLSVIII